MATAQEAEKALQTLIEKMGVSLEVVVHDDAERTVLELKGEDTGLAIGKKGQTLDALQYLVNKMIYKDTTREEGSKPIQIDAEGYRVRREEALVELAQKLAEKAVRTTRPVAADPMTAADRRIIHMALADHPEVETKSEGEGIYRHLVVIPKAPVASEVG